MKHLLIIALSISTVYGSVWHSQTPQSSKPNNPGQGWRPQAPLQTQCRPGAQNAHPQSNRPSSNAWNGQNQGYRPKPLPNQHLVKPGESWRLPGYFDQNSGNKNGWGQPIQPVGTVEWQSRPQRPLIDIPYTIEIVNHLPQNQLNSQGGWKQQIRRGWSGSKW